MKTIYKVLYPVGYEEHEVADDFPTSIPFVEDVPISFKKKEEETENEFLNRQQSQFYNFSKNKWEEVVTQNYSEQIEMLEVLTEAVQRENEELKKAAEEQAIQMTDTQLAIAEVYEMLVPANKEAK
ncbi:hypothetical protein [Enterococcus gilvus]|uniref:hypothetical protein n=1 Tax=Enterococcus gilvus TaxID=160453 RepID=UPI00290C3B44|nr:hypothetical protein [Enterococcus gilvus]MDU5509583.1 hypothetical protein [Enterococcus gilvus]